MNEMSRGIPKCIESDRLYLRCYKAGDGPMYYAVSQRNRVHLSRYEAENVVMGIESVKQAEDIVKELSADWDEQSCFFMGVFEKDTDEFLAQIYIGPVNWDVPEMEIGFFADVNHEGQGYVTEAVKAALGFIFEYLGAHRVRLECDDTNVRSQKVAERCGMVREGHIRENKRNVAGSLSGTMHYGILKKEFSKIHGSG